MTEGGKLSQLWDKTINVHYYPGFPGDSVNNLSTMQKTTCNARDPGSIPGSGRFPAEGNGNPLQDSCLGNTEDRGAWRATVCEVPRVGHHSVAKQPAPHYYPFQVNANRF